MALRLLVSAPSGAFSHSVPRERGNRSALDGWQPLQAELAKLSTNGVHRVLGDATHESIVESHVDSARSVEAIRDVVLAARKKSTTVVAFPRPVR